MEGERFRSIVTFVMLYCINFYSILRCDFVLDKSRFKNVVAILDNDFGSLRILKDDTSSYVNDIDLTDSSKNLLSGLAAHNSNLYLLLRENLDSTVCEQVKLFLPSSSSVIPFNNNLDSILRNLAGNSVLEPNETIFVSSDRTSRHIASAIGYFSLPHTKLARMALEGKTFGFVRMIGCKSTIDKLDNEDVLPYYLNEKGSGECEFLCITSHSVVNESIQHGLEAQIYDVDLSHEDIVLVNLDKIVRNQLLTRTLNQYKLIYSDSEKMVVTVGKNKIANIPLHGSHGHYVQLIPNDILLLSSDSMRRIKVGSDLSISERTLHILKRWPSSNTKSKLTSGNLPESSKIELDLVDPNSLLSNIKKYSGSADLDSGGKIKSRHCLHADNRRAVESLSQDLKQIGYFTQIWEFQTTERPPGVPPTPGVEGATFYDVIAELPGTGDDSQIENNLSPIIKSIFLKHHNPLVDLGWISEIKEVAGEAWFTENNLDSLPPLELKRTLENIFGLEPWTQWWLKEKVSAGMGSEILIIGCHLDSTAQREDNPDFHAATSIAPGADDDGSGLSATIELARVFAKLKGRLKHTILFCFFNAEEVGLRGSLEYAKHMRLKNAPIKAVICMDMIGYNKDDSNRTFEIHSGFENELVRDICLPVANIMADCSEILGKLGVAQIYKGLKPSPENDEESGDPANREKYDPAIQRSDHWSFQQLRYPAIVVSEDFFVNEITLGEPKADGNPNYHHFKDTFAEIDPNFAADIANSVALSIKKLAER